MADFNTIGTRAGVGSAEIDAGLRAHMNKVYGTMSVGLLVTALLAWAIAGLTVTSDPNQAVIALSNGTMLNSFGEMIYGSPLRWVVMFAPFLLVMGFGVAMQKMSAAGLQLYFYVYAALMGLSLSSIFLVYTGFSITQVFLVTSISFAGLSLYGYATKKDLSGMGAFLMMGLIGLFVAMIVNMFLQSGVVELAISVIGVLIFAGLTAYDTQKIKTEYIAHAHAMDQDWLGKSAISGALRLYLDFVNLFLFMLRLFGNRS